MTTSRLRRRLQTDFPISSDPYGDLARALDRTREGVYAQVAAWRRARLIRRIGPIFDPSAIGWRTTLCAVRRAPDAVALPRSSLKRIQQVLKACDGVTHAYLRAGDASAPDLWFTVGAPGAKALKAVVADLEARLGLGPVLSLPARLTFKIRAVFGSADSQESASRPPTRHRRRRTLANDPLTRRILVATQGGLPVGRDPYGQVARRLGVDPDVLLDRLRRLKEAGIIRRVGAIFNQRGLGLEGNCLVAWRVPQARVGEVGGALAEAAAVTHCYERRRARGWPYNVYTMVHARDEAACRRLVSAMARRVGDWPRTLLFTRRELKKTPPRYT